MSARSAGTARATRKTPIARMMHEHQDAGGDGQAAEDPVAAAHAAAPPGAGQLAAAGRAGGGVGVPAGSDRPDRVSAAGGIAPVLMTRSSVVGVTTATAPLQDVRQAGGGGRSVRARAVRERPGPTLGERGDRRARPCR